MRPHWIRRGRNDWQQYVGRRVRRVKNYFVAWAGNEWRGCHDDLAAAMKAAESPK